MEAMPRNRDEESGRFTTAYPPEAFIEAVADQGPDVGTGDIAEAVGCTREYASTRLKKLEVDEGRLRSRTVGTVKLWSIADEHND